MSETAKCRCGHTRDDHYKGKLACAYGHDTWCPCDAFRPAEATLAVPQAPKTSIPADVAAFLAKIEEDCMGDWLHGTATLLLDTYGIDRDKGVVALEGKRA